MNRTDRLHAIFEALRRAGGDGATAAQLADRFEVSVRTIKRDVDALQQGGALIWGQHGPGGGYRLDASASLPPVAFTPSQAVAAAVALAMLPPGSPFAVDARAAAAKVLDTLEGDPRERAATLASRVWVRDAPVDHPTPPPVLRAVERSLTERVTLAISYRAVGATASTRVVEPVMLACEDRRWYVVAHCRLRDGIRWFRLDRIERAHTTTEPYEPRPVASVGEPPGGAEPVQS